MRRVSRFAVLLDKYVDVEADLFHFTEPGMDWTRFGVRAIRRADTVLIISSDAYWERWEGDNHPGVGAGSVREIDALHGLFDRDQQEFQRKAVIVLLPGQNDRSIPYELSRVQRYAIASISEAGIEPLLRRLFNVPEYRKSATKLIPRLADSGGAGQ